MLKVITWGVVIVIAVGGIWYFVNQSAPSVAVPENTGTPTSAVPQNSQASTGVTNTSDAQLQADLNASDSQIQSAGSAGASAGTFSDTPVTQTE